MEQNQENELKEIMGGLSCPKDFKCYKERFKKLCKTRDVGLESYLECLEEDPFDCPFKISFGGVYYCNGPLRLYIASKLKV